MLGHLPPGLILIAGALLLPLMPRNVRGWGFLVFPILTLLHLGGLDEGARATWDFATFELVPLEVDTLANVFGWIFALVTLIAGIYALHIRDTGQQSSALLYAGSGLGAVYAGDLFTLVFFWEIMAFSAAYLVWARGTAESYDSAMRYLFVHIFGGSLLLGGVLWHLSETGSLAFQAFEPGWPAYLILAGFAVNAAVVPLHAWIADAYPRGTLTGSVFLSAFTTKTAVYTMARGFSGWEILVWAGVLMAVYGVTYAILANDIRRVLAYHIVSQVGFMVVGVGIGTPDALNGATSHAYTHILYKGLLFMATGAVIYATGRSRMTELGGLMGKLPWTFWAYMVAALSISSAPFFSGFVSKPMTIHAAEYDSTATVVLLLHLASVGTFLSVGLKVPYYTWFGEQRDVPVKPIPWNMYAAMGIGAGLNIIMGLWPGPLYDILPYPVEFDPYELKNLKKGFQLLLFTALGFFLIAHRLAPKAKVQLDTDWFYRRADRVAWDWTVAPVARFFSWWEEFSWKAAGDVARVGRDPVGWIQDRLGAGRAGAPVPEASAASSPRASGTAGSASVPESTLARASMTLMMGIFLLAVLVVLARTLF